MQLLGGPSEAPRFSFLLSGFCFGIDEDAIAMLPPSPLTSTPVRLQRVFCRVFTTSFVLA